MSLKSGIEEKMRHHRTKSVRLLKAQYKIYDKKYTIRDIQIAINENETRQLSLQVKKRKIETQETEDVD